MTTNTHRMSSFPSARARWKTIAMRLLSLAVVLVVGGAVYVGADRAVRQDCLNRAFQASLNERAKATDDLIDALGQVNDGLRTANTPARVAAARRTFADSLARVEADRERTRNATAARQEASCA